MIVDLAHWLNVYIHSLYKSPTWSDHMRAMWRSSAW